ncbi:Response regulator containing a CheY-like protein receiver domain and an HD-GYP domain-like protein [Shewanella sediminis HAW-EB3]|uniref:Response regulator containing a CheY-like protein receiver domain and an HD-GYP domain-like protein n=1 Tax=Shewanella sediminis (strain HAW-EB3) TaxID=425104 RepID=A8FYF0_SHESH|nr:HD domain-containing phosphohydrolase [Shewanella sediminis]ABV37873.1 Response regulator containing a CheY-like protein receiver domain and an HD-GYP domain-like protein [Shewanella sediminis HAW-EB3]
MNTKVTYLKFIVVTLFLIWTILIVSILINWFSQENRHAERLALKEATVSIKKDLAYRSWVTSHGGVYVPITEHTQPNPYLAHIPNRDIKTETGQGLTLMNPAYAIKQTMKNYSELYGTKGRIVSNTPLNPDNKADKWESDSLNIIEDTRTPHHEIHPIDGQEHMRLIIPLFTEEGCLKCHGHQGYKVGDVRGGISASIALSPYYTSAVSRLKASLPYVAVVWLIGVATILLGYWRTRRYISEKIASYEQHIFSIVDMIENRDSYTAGHTKRVGKYASLIAKQMGYSDRAIDKLYRASMVHDVGKISTPDSILLKPGRLSPLERKIIQQHVVTSYQMLKRVDIFQGIAEIVRHHHEHYDGSGYPQGLKGEQIPMLSQIMSVADAFDAMTTDRVYKGRKTIQSALEELQLLGGKQFNAEVVKAAQIALKGVASPKSNQLPVNEIEKERFAYFYKDQLTGAYNRDYLNNMLLINSDKYSEAPYNCINLILLTNFTQYNKEQGWEKGNKILIDVTQSLIFSFPEALIFRIHGDDFIVLHKQHYPIEGELGPIDALLCDTGISLDTLHVNIKEDCIGSVDKLDNWLTLNSDETGSRAHDRISVNR